MELTAAEIELIRLKREEDVKWWIEHYADKLRSTSDNKCLMELKEKIEQLELYLKEMNSLK